jgi:hypothetical protein
MLHLTPFRYLLSCFLNITLHDKPIRKSLPGTPSVRRLSMLQNAPTRNMSRLTLHLDKLVPDTCRYAALPSVRHYHTLLASLAGILRIWEHGIPGIRHGRCHIKLSILPVLQRHRVLANTRGRMGEQVERCRAVCGLYPLRHCPRASLNLYVTLGRKS